MVNAEEFEEKFEEWLIIRKAILIPLRDLKSVVPPQRGERDKTTAIKLLKEGQAKLEQLWEGAEDQTIRVMLLYVIAGFERQVEFVGNIDANGLHNPRSPLEVEKQHAWQELVNAMLVNLDYFHRVMSRVVYIARRLGTKVKQTETKGWLNQEI